MAVPKKKTSKARARSRYANWLNKANLHAERALSTGRSLLSQRAEGFYYPKAAETEQEE